MTRRLLTHLLLGALLALLAATVVSTLIALLLVALSGEWQAIPLAMAYGIAVGWVMAAPVTLFVLPLCYELLRMRIGNMRVLLFPGALAGSLTPAATLAVLSPSLSDAPFGAMLAAPGGVAGAFCGLAYAKCFGRSMKSPNPLPEPYVEPAQRGGK